MILYDSTTVSSLARLSTGELAWLEQREEWDRTHKCECGQPYHQMLGGSKVTCLSCYPYMMFDIREVLYCPPLENTCSPLTAKTHQPHVPLNGG